MSLRTTTVLALIFAALAAYLYFVEIPRKIDDDRPSPVLSFDRAAVSHIEVEHPGRKVVLEREDDQWRILDPITAPADQRSVDNLIGAVAECMVDRTLEEIEGLGTYGLDVPSATVRLKAGNVDLGTIEVGKHTPVGSSLYIRRNNDGAVLLTNASFATRIDQRPDDLRDKTILAFEEADVRSVKIQSTHGEVVLSKRDEGWLITAPGDYDADATAVDGVLSTLKSMRATEFVDEAAGQLKRYGLEPTGRKVTLGLAGGEAIELRLGSEIDGKLYVQTNQRPTIYAVAAWVITTLDKDVKHFRDKGIVSFAAEDAARIEIDSSDEPGIELQRSDKGWTATAGNAAVKVDIVDELLLELSALQGFEIAADTAQQLSLFGLDPPRRSIRVRDREGVLLGALHIGTHATEGAQTEYAAIADESPTVFHLREYVYQRIDKGPRELLEKAPVSEGPATPVPDGEAGDGVDENTLGDAAAAGEQR